MLDTVKPYVKVFRNAGDILQADNVINLRIHLIKAHLRRQYIMPTIDEVATLIMRVDYGRQEERDIIVHKIDVNL